MDAPCARLGGKKCPRVSMRLRLAAALRRMSESAATMAEEMAAVWWGRKERVDMRPVP